MKDSFLSGKNFIKKRVNLVRNTLLISYGRTLRLNMTQGIWFLKDHRKWYITFYRDNGQKKLIDTHALLEISFSREIYGVLLLEICFSWEIYGVPPEIKMKCPLYLINTCSKVFYIFLVLLATLVDLIRNILGSGMGIKVALFKTADKWKKRFLKAFKMIRFWSNSGNLLDIVLVFV